MTTDIQKNSLTRQIIILLLVFSTLFSFFLVFTFIKEARTEQSYMPIVHIILVSLPLFASISFVVFSKSIFNKKNSRFLGISTTMLSFSFLAALYIFIDDYLYFSSDSYQYLFDHYKAIIICTFTLIAYYAFLFIIFGLVSILIFTRKLRYTRILSICSAALTIICSIVLHIYHNNVVEFFVYNLLLFAPYLLYLFCYPNTKKANEVSERDKSKNNP